jgi:hypothetical protein
MQESINYCFDEQPYPDPVLGWVPRLSRYTLIQDYYFEYESLVLNIPAGTTTDLASVPRSFWWFISSSDLGIIAPFIHDELYKWAGNVPSEVGQCPKMTRGECDQLLLKLCALERVPQWKSTISYFGVRVLGYPFWWWRKRNRQKYLKELEYVLSRKHNTP